MFTHPKYGNGFLLLILAFLLLGRRPIAKVPAECALAPGRAPRNDPERAPVAMPVANVAWGLCLAYWIGAVSSRLWREFYFWTVADNDPASGVA